MAERFPTDLVLPEDEGDDVVATATGDWPTLAGRDNVRAAIRRRVLAQPGELVHRPEYGGGLPGWVERPNTASTRARLATDLRRNVLRDPRIGDCRASVALEDDQLTVGLSVVVRGDEVADQITLTYSE